MKILNYLYLLFISLLLVACSSARNTSNEQVNQALLTPPPNSKPTAYHDPGDYGLDPEVKAEINKNAGEDYSEESDFRKATITGGKKGCGKMWSTQEKPSNIA